jgi:hypothetical protein
MAFTLPFVAGFTLSAREELDTHGYQARQHISDPEQDVQAGRFWPSYRCQ